MKTVRVASWICLACALAACSSSHQKLDLGGTCSLNSDCNEPLLCKFGYCHKACVRSVDCDNGGRCVVADGVAVCQTQAESACSANGTCSGGLVCRAVDNSCRTPCSPTNDTSCVAGQTCNGTVCLENGELASTGSDAGAGAGDGAAGPDAAALVPDLPAVTPDAAAPDVPLAPSDAASADLGLSDGATKADGGHAADAAGDVWTGGGSTDGNADAGLRFSFFDGTFANGDWTSLKVSDTSPLKNSTFLAEQRTTTGDPGEYRHIMNSWCGDGSTSQGIAVAHIYTPRNYAPAATGPIDSIDYSFSVRMAPVTDPNAIGFALVLEQDGNYYSAGYNVATSASWTRVSNTGLTANSFGLVYGSGPSLPNFSAGAPPIRFGYYTSNSTGGSGCLVTNGGIDNFEVVVVAVGIMGM